MSEDSTIQTTDGKAESGPGLLRNLSFQFFTLTESLGAFNDNVFKQLVMLLCVNQYLVLYGTRASMQGLVTFLFPIPFLFLSGLAGRLADRYSKATVMTWCKVAEIFIMGTGLAVLSLAGNHTPAGHTAFLLALAFITMLMGAHSAFFGPAKYSVLPEMVREKDMSRANSIVGGTTMAMIIAGIVTAGYLKEWFGDRLYLAGFFYVAIAVIGTLTSLGVRRAPAAAPAQPLGSRKMRTKVGTVGDVLVTSTMNPPQMLWELWKKDRMLVMMMTVYSWFYLVAGVAANAILDYGVIFLNVGEIKTSLLSGAVLIGTIIGYIILGWISKEKIKIKALTPGVLGLLVCLVALFMVPVNDVTAEQLHAIEAAQAQGQSLQEAGIQLAVASLQKYFAVMGIFFAAGICIALLFLPTQTFVQMRPSATDRGRAVAAFGWESWLFTVGASTYYMIGMPVVAYRPHALLLSLAVITAGICAFAIPYLYRTLRKEKPSYVEI